jgi:hypothetical protein
MPPRTSAAVSNIALNCGASTRPNGRVQCRHSAFSNRCSSSFGLVELDSLWLIPPCYQAISEICESSNPEPRNPAKGPDTCSIVPSGNSASTYHSSSKSFFSSRGLNMGFGYFFAIASNMPPVEDRAIDVGQGRAICPCCLLPEKQSRPCRAWRWHGLHGVLRSYQRNA